MLAGVLESPQLRCQDLSDSSDNPLKIKNTLPSEPLSDELGIHVLDCRKPYLPFSEFYNDILSDAVEMDRDFANYKTETGNSYGLLCAQCLSEKLVYYFVNYRK